MGAYFNTIYRVAVCSDSTFGIHGDKFSIQDIRKFSQDELVELRAKLEDVLASIKRDRGKIKKGVRAEIKEEKAKEEEDLIDPDTGEKKRRKRRTKAEMELARQKEDQLKKIGIKRITRKGN